MPEKIPTVRRTATRTRIALVGTMATPWRSNIAPHLEAVGLAVVMNTDARWLNATTALKKRPLLEQDLRIMRDADLILWHYDAAGGRTAGIELGILTQIGPPVIVHIDQDAHREFRAYVHALTMLFPKTLHWVETFDEAVDLAEIMTAPEEEAVIN